MANNLVQVTLASADAIPENFTVNTWSFTTAVAKDIPSAESITDILADAYHSWDEYYSDAVGSTAVVKFYDRADAQPRVPWHTDEIALNHAAGTKLPDEVACCISFRAAYVSGSPAARRRGRVYIGPLAVSAAGATSAGNRPAQGLINTLLGGAEIILEASNGTADWTWNVWSSVDSAGREVIGGWVDNAFDTQRRRGVDATARQEFPAA